LFVDIGSGRTGLILPPDVMLNLSGVLLGHERFAMAAWFKYFAMAAWFKYNADTRMGVETLEIQKSILEFSDQAKRQNKPKRLRLFLICI